MHSHSLRRPQERGSALLIVFVFAAIVAIMLYREMPVSLFEAQRQKEQVLVDRGHEYVRAVQLFYRRNRGQYPSSFEQLENTNNIRYLRHRYTDPFTGKDDWRLLHAGPGGMLLDSKLSPAQQMAGATGQPAANGQPGIGGQSSLSGNSSSSGGFGSPSPVGSSTFGSSSSSNSSSDASVVVPPLPTRAPAVAANGAGGGANASQMPSSQALDQNPDAPLLPPSTNDGTQASGTDGTDRRRGANGNGQPGQTPGVMQTLNPVIGSGTPPTGFASQPGSSGGSGFGQMNGGGALAGVASKAKGHAIKVINDQADYSLWEFYYNPATDPTGRTALGGGSSAPVQTGAPGVTAPTNGAGLGLGSATPASSTATDSSSTTTDGSNANGGTTSTGIPVSPNLPPQQSPQQ